MSPEKIIDLAKQADWPDSLIAPVIMQKLNDFAKLVAQHERERIATNIERLPFGDTAASFAIYVRELKDE
jgi:sensor c-di-GMP phosphodiesterase-like protein